jgi:hypothetical protein
MRARQQDLTRIRPMRRWLSFLLLVLLPFQFTWSVAASYCGHESAASTRHVGHHVHQHVDAAVKDAKASKASQSSSEAPLKAPAKLTLDTDCGTCHLSAAKSVPGVDAVLPVPAAQVLTPIQAARFSTRAPDHPERPNWRIA